MEKGSKEGTMISHQATHPQHTKSTKATATTYVKIATTKQDETGIATTTKEEGTEVEEISAPEEEESAI